LGTSRSVHDPARAVVIAQLPAASEVALGSPASTALSLS
jgi:hypothetical protein